VWSTFQTILYAFRVLPTIPQTSPHFWIPHFTFRIPHFTNNLIIIIKYLRHNVSGKLPHSRVIPIANVCTIPLKPGKIRESSCRISRILPGSTTASRTSAFYPYRNDPRMLKDCSFSQSKWPSQACWIKTNKDNPAYTSIRCHFSFNQTIISWTKLRHSNL